MIKRKHTTVSLRRETYAAGLRFMKERGYASWEALVLGLVSGHRFSRGDSIEIDLGPLEPLVKERAPRALPMTKSEMPVVVNSTSGSRLQNPNVHVLHLSCDQCKRNFDLAWDPSSAVDVSLLTKVCETKSWTCDNCASPNPKQEQDQRIPAARQERAASLMTKRKAGILLVNTAGPNSKFRFERLADSRLFDSRSFGTIALSGAKDHKLIVACPNGHYDDSAKTCTGGMRPQALLHPKDEHVCPLSSNRSDFTGSTR